MTLPAYITGLLYPQVKAARAAFHLQELRVKSNAFRNGKPYTVAEYDDAERGEHVVIVGLGRADVMLAVLVGEFAYALRGSLDHLAWQLGLLSGKRPETVQASNWNLNRLCNFDKHSTVGFSHTAVNISVPPEATVLTSETDLKTEIRYPLALKGKRRIES